MNQARKSTVRIGCAAAFWGDTQSAVGQLITKGDIDYLVGDYLAEITMSILTAKRMRNPDEGYAIDFVLQLQPYLAQIKEQGIKVVSNSGGVNPKSCRDALQMAAEEAGVELQIAVVLGDDLRERAKELEGTIQPLEAGEKTPPNLLSMNAYLGALPIKAALDAGADVVITGRCVDSAVVLGPLMHEFDWQAGDYDKLASGSLAGHIVECGAQCTGGNFTDWEKVPGYEDMGFPVVEVEPDGSFTVSKPPGTGGLVSTDTVCEQMLYEIGDPRAYMLPDVVCDFTRVKLEQVGENQVRVSGAKGLPPTDTYKVSATYPSGQRSTAMFMIGGIDAAKKARRVGEAILSKTSAMFSEQDLGEYTGTDIEVLGAEDTYGPHSRAGDTREVIVKIAVTHDNPKALKLFTREIAQAATGMTPGVTGYFGGRPRVTPVVKLFSCLVPKSVVEVQFDIDGAVQAVTIPTEGGFNESQLPEPVHGEVAQPVTDAQTLPLVSLALGRSGDKGDHANIGIIARKPEYLPYLRAALTEEAVAEYFAHLLEGEVTRWELPGTDSFNFLLTHALGGGGIASLRADPQGKCFAQMLLDYPVPVPEEIAEAAA